MEATTLETRAGVTFEALPIRSVLNRSAAKRVPMDLTINPYRGCEFGCRYCYARYTHAWLDHPDPLAFERHVYAKLEAPAVLAGELASLDLRGRSIAIGSATDPYQPLERRLGITRGILECLTSCRGASISLITKSDLVTRDLDVLALLAERHHLAVSLTLVTLDRDLQRKLEPRAPTPEKRLTAMAALAAAGIRCGVSHAPIMPWINDGESAMRELLARVADAGGGHAQASPLWVCSGSREVFMEWLGERFPELVPRYRRLYRGGIELPAATHRELVRRFERLRIEVGLTDRLARPVYRQLPLFADG